MPPRDANLNALWCRCIIEEAVRAGCGHAVLCPGSRNSPLLFACAALSALGGDQGHPGLILHGQVDERSAGFLALGLAKASDRPALVCVTSGSALANLLPAVVEADAAGIPLVVLAADRPWEVHGVGAPQTMPQRGVFGSFVRAEIALGEAVADDATLRQLRARIARAVQAPGGPVLINVPLRDPLPPIDDGSWQCPVLSSEAMSGRGHRQPYSRQVRARAQRSTIDGDDLGYLRSGLRGLIVVGAAGVGSVPVIRDFAIATGYPLLADAPSGLRIPGVPAITTADALLRGDWAQLRPELVIQIGCAPLARSVYEYLSHQQCPWLALEPRANRDVLARAWSVISEADESTYLELARRCGPGEVSWRERWLKAEDFALRAWEAHMLREPWGEVLAAHLTCTHTGFRCLHLASSMAVRHGNLHCRLHSEQRIFANRGLNGIDGTISTFLGENIALGGGGLLMCGDLAFLHDANALAQVARQPNRTTTHGAIVVINNGGGGIFDFLAVSQVPGWQQWVRAPQQQQIGAAAAQFLCPYLRVTDAAGLRSALQQAARATDMMVIECVVPESCVERQRCLISAMAAVGALE